MGILTKKVENCGGLWGKITNFATEVVWMIEN